MTDPQRKEILEHWLQNHKGLVFKVIRVYADSTEDRDDLFQEICLQLWKSISSFKRQSAETTWIYRISLNTSIKWIKKETKFKEKKESKTDDLLLKAIETNDPIDEKLAWLYNEIAQMNEIDKSLALLLLDGLSYKEMSSIVGLNPNSIGVRIHRIKNELIKKSVKFEY